jgi:hypothetical protein
VPGSTKCSKQPFGYQGVTPLGTGGEWPMHFCPGRVQI